MKQYSEMSKSELSELHQDLLNQYKEAKEMGLNLDMSRGKPSPAQLDLSEEMLNVLTSKSSLKAENGIDCRNYGLLEGIPEARKLMGDVMGVPADNVMIFGNASLNIMFDLVSNAMTHGIMGSTPWCKLDKVKFLCPVPGYDRHFAVTEYFGIEMINIPMTAEGPDMDLVEKYVNNDDTVKGIWCVPKFSNPQGVVYSDETVRRFAKLRPAAKDFRIFWDNAYAIHNLYDEDIELLEIFNECNKAGNPDMVYELCSTSKISFAGGGISALATSPENMKSFKKRLTIETIGYDKVNQLRHARYFKNIDGLKKQMKKHAEIMAPKFDSVIRIFEKEIGPTGAGSWLVPKGGYFISFNSMNGCAKAIVAKCKEAGVVLTKAGATYPYGKDPDDSNIRIAPSYPSKEELEMAAKLFTLCVKLVSVEKLLEN